jgi:hypothetical protein
MPEKQIQINRFDLGMADEDRDLGNGYFKYLENVNCGDNARGIKQVSNVTSNATLTRQISTLISGTFPTLGFQIFGLGSDGGSPAKNSIWASASGGNATWTSSTPAASYNFLGKNNPFFVSDGTYIYFDNTNKIGRFPIPSQGGSAMDGDWSSLIGGLSGGMMWQGSPYGWASNNQIYKVVVTAPTSMIQIPINQPVSQQIDYGNLMAIICSSNIEDSKMYLWDGVTTTTFYDIVNIGKGQVIGGARLSNGTIRVVIADHNGLGFRIKDYNGNGFSTIFRYSAPANTTGTKNIWLSSKVKILKDFIYFMGLGTRGGQTGTSYPMIFRYGKKLSGGQDSLSIYNELGYASAFTSSNPYSDFIIPDSIYFGGDYTSIFAVNDEGSYTMKETLSSGVYTAQAGVIETSKYTGGDSSIEKQLSEMSIMCNPLTTGQSIALYYKPNADTTWTEIITINTVGTISYEPVCEADGTNLRTSKEVAFKFLLLGGAELTGFTAKYQPQMGQR